MYVSLSQEEALQIPLMGALQDKVFTLQSGKFEWAFNVASVR